MKVRTIIALAMGAFAFAAGVSAQQREFAVINPSQPTEGGGKVEVLEFFWYGCNHCNALEPQIEKWTAKVPGDVVFKRVPAVPSEHWKPAAQLFYTLEAMGLLEKLHKKVFEAIHKENLNIVGPGSTKARDEWLVKQGVDLAKFNDVQKSFSVVTKVNRAAQLTAGYKVDGVPMLYVNGKYQTSNTHTKGDLARVMPVVDELVELSRKENAKSAAAEPPKPATAKK